ncbi:MAG: hypothetical protein QXD53_04385 [Candidatus Bathyarchaeia archaeon]
MAFSVSLSHEELREIQMMERLEITGRICFDHYINPAYSTDFGYVWLFKQDYEGYKFPEEKPMILEIIENGLKIDEILYIHGEDLVEKPL